MGLSKRTVASYADELEAERRAAPSVPNQLQAGMPVEPDSVSDVLGVYRDPWFGEVSVCARDGGVQFVAAKSPRLAGTLMQVADRVLVDWRDESVDVDAWLDFSTDQGTAVMLMTKVDPEADFSFDFEDLRLVRTGPCP